MYKRIITFTGRIIETQLCALGPRSAGTPKGYVHTHTHTIRCTRCTTRPSSYIIKIYKIIIILIRLYVYVYECVLEWSARTVVNIEKKMYIILMQRSFYFSYYYYYTAFDINLYAL